MTLRVAACSMTELTSSRRELVLPCATPKIAELLDSVPPEVKKISEG